MHDFHQGMTPRLVKTCLLLLLPFILLACNNSNQVDAQIQKVEASPKPVELKPVETKSVQLTFKQKEIPVLGNTQEQLDFKVEDAQAKISGNPRPTYPKTLAVLAGNPPPDVDVCKLSFSAVTMAIYEKCIKPGMSFIEVSNMIGFKGTNLSEKGATAIYTWETTDEGLMTVTFESDKLVSKSQVNLK